MVVDDIHIPSVASLCRFLTADSMFELREKLRGRTALFTRTDAAAFDPLGDGWWLQEFNVRNLPLSAQIWNQLPDRIRRTLKAVLRYR